jgi:tetratricopeptide (TPR) repeat protein
MAEKDPLAPELPRGATPAELDELRVAVKVAARGAPPKPSAPPPPSASQALMHRADLDRIIDEGRVLLESDTKNAHVIFEKAYRKNVNDARVLSNYGLTLVLVEGDRQRGIRFCEEAVRRGLLTTESLVNLAKALVQTRNKEQAVRALRRAMELAPDDPRVGDEFAALGLRRPPAIPWLPRNFFLNKWLGRFTWWFSRRHRLNPLSY